MQSKFNTYISRKNLTSLSRSDWIGKKVRIKDLETLKKEGSISTLNRSMMTKINDIVTIAFVELGRNPKFFKIKEDGERFFWHILCLK